MEKTRLLDRGRWVVALVVLSGFGPYLLSVGLRLEHVVIYGLSAIALANILRCRTSPVSAPVAAGVLLPLAVAALWGGLVAWWSLPAENPVLVMASLDNYLQPIALYLLLVWGGARASVPEMRTSLVFGYRLMLLALALNALLALSHMFVDTWPLVRFFVQGESEPMGTVWQRAARLGRYCGIFNQPVEAGIAYGLGLFAWGQLFLAERRLNLSLFYLLAMLLLGGLLSVSKVFLMVAVPLFACWVLINRQELPLKCLQATHGWWAIGVVTVFVALMAWRWQGVNRLKKTLGLADQVGSRGFWSRLTGKRFGEADSNVLTAFREVWENAPLQGFGFGLRRGFDNAYLEFFYQGGSVGLMLYLAVLVWLGLLGRRVLSWSRSEGSMLLLILIFVVVAGLGAPVLTINRSSILLWLLLIMFLELDARRYQVGNS